MYPPIDPDKFFEVLPAMPRQAEIRRADPVHFDQHGYTVGEEGALISPAHVWTKRVGADPYDVDLSVNVIWLPSKAMAEKGFSAAVERMSLLGARVNQLPTAVQNAEESRFVQIQQRAGSIHHMDARYGNYMFAFTARVASHGYFETEADLVAGLQTLDRHIHETLQSAT